MPITAKRPRTQKKTGKISRWGNSFGLRIPREAVEQLGLVDGASVTLEIAADRLTIRSAHRRKKWTAAELLRGVTPDMVGGEVDWGGPVGKELL